MTKSEFLLSFVPHLFRLLIEEAFLRLFGQKGKHSTKWRSVIKLGQGSVLVPRYETSLVITIISFCYL